MLGEVIVIDDEDDREASPCRVDGVEVIVIDSSDSDSDCECISDPTEEKMLIKRKCNLDAELFPLTKRKDLDKFLLQGNGIYGNARIKLEKQSKHRKFKHRSKTRPQFQESGAKFAKDRVSNHFDSNKDLPEREQCEVSTNGIMSPLCISDEDDAKPAAEVCNQLPKPLFEQFDRGTEFSSVHADNELLHNIGSERTSDIPCKKFRHFLDVIDSIPDVMTNGSSADDVCFSPASTLAYCSDSDCTVVSQTSCHGTNNETTERLPEVRENTLTVLNALLDSCKAKTVAGDASFALGRDTSLPPLLTHDERKDTADNSLITYKAKLNVFDTHEGSAVLDMSSVTLGSKEAAEEHAIIFCQNSENLCTTSAVQLDASSPTVDSCSLSSDDASRTVSPDVAFHAIESVVTETCANLDDHIYSPLSINVPKGIMKANASVKLDETLSDMVLACIDEGLEDKSALMHMMQSISTTLWKPKKKFICYLINLIWKVTELELFQELHTLLCHIHNLHGFSFKLNLREMLEKAYSLDWDDEDCSKIKIFHTVVKSEMFRFVCHILETDALSGSYAADSVLNRGMCVTLKNWLEDTIRSYSQSQESPEPNSNLFNILISIQKLLSLKYLTNRNNKLFLDFLASELCKIFGRLNGEQRHLLISTIQLPEVVLKVHETLLYDVSSYPSDMEVCSQLEKFQHNAPCTLKKITNYYFFLEPKTVPAEDELCNVPPTDSIVGCIQQFVGHLANLLESYLDICKGERCLNPVHVSDELPRAEAMQTHISKLIERLRKKHPEETEDHGVRCSFLTLQATCFHLEC